MIKNSLSIKVKPYAPNEAIADSVAIRRYEDTKEGCLQCSNFSILYLSKWEVLDVVRRRSTEETWSD